MTQPTRTQEDREDVIRLSKRMKPEERLLAYFYHSQFIGRLYQAGVRYRSGSMPSSRKKMTRRR